MILGSEKGLKCFIIALLFHLYKKEQWENCNGLEKSIKTTEASETRWLILWEIQQCEYPNEPKLSVSEVDGEVLNSMLFILFLYILNSLTFAHLFSHEEHFSSLYNTHLYSTILQFLFLLWILSYFLRQWCQNQREGQVTGIYFLPSVGSGRCLKWADKVPLAWLQRLT